MVFEVGKISNDKAAFEAAMQELEEILQKNSHLKDSPRMLIQRGRLLTNRGQIAESMPVYEEAIDLAISQNNIAMHGLALRMRSANMLETKDISAAEADLKKAIELFYAIDQKYQIAACLHTLSIAYLASAEFDKYLETSEETLRMLKASGADDIAYARAYVNTMVARCVEMLNVKLYDRAKVQLEELINSPELPLAGEYGYINTMLTYGQYLNETSQFKKSNEVLLPLLDGVAGIPINQEIAAIYSYLAENMVALEKYKEASGYIQIAMDFHRQVKLVFFLAENLLCYASILIRQQKKKEAEAICREAEGLVAESQSDFQLWQFHKKYAIFFGKQKNYQRAYEHTLIAQQHQARSMQTDYDKRISSITHRYELMEKEKENELLKKDIDMKKQELSMTSDFLNQKIDLLKEMKGFMKSMRKENMEKNEMMKALDRKIDSVLNVEYEQQLFIEKIEIAGNDFIAKLRKVYPALTLTEAKVCSLVRNNFSNKEIANLLITSIRTIENHRYHIGKKLNIKGDNRLQALLLSIK